MLKFVVAASALVLSSPAFALQAAPPAPAKAANPAKDPNRIICEREDEIGSRLGGKKVCKTAADWAEERRLHRENLEKAQQMGTGMPNGN
jgi:hypothetical protein